MLVICNGTRFKPEALNFKIQKINIAELSAYSIQKLAAFFDGIKLTSRQLLIADRILKEINDRLKFLVHVGVRISSLIVHSKLFRAVKVSAFAWQHRLAPLSLELLTFWMSRASASISATMIVCSSPH